MKPLTRLFLLIFIAVVVGLLLAYITTVPSYAVTLYSAITGVFVMDKILQFL